MSTIDAVIDSPQQAQGLAWWFLDTLVVEHAMASDQGPVVLETTLPVGTAPSLHVHLRRDDSWFLIDGEVVVRCGEERTVARPGHWVSMPKGAPHGFRVMGERPARILAVHEDRAFLDFVRDLGTPAGALVLPEPTGGPGAEILGASMAAHDITVVGDSLSQEDALAVLARQAGGR